MKRANSNLTDRKRTRSSKSPGVIHHRSAKQPEKHVEEEITTLKQQMEFILGVTKTGLDIIDSQFNILYIDPEWAKLYGDPVGKKCYQYFMDRGQVCPGCGIPKALETRKVTVTEEILTKEGNRPIQVTTIPFQNSKGEWLVAEVNVDISERKRAEEALRKAHDELEIRVQQRTAELADANEALQVEIAEQKRSEEALRISEERYRTILDNIEDGYYEVDLAGNFTSFNDPICRLLGYSKDELTGMNDRQYTDQENAQKLYQTFNKVYKTGEPTKGFGWEIIRKDGTKRYIEASVSLMKNRSGQSIGFRGIVRDITERKRAEQALRQSEEKYRLLAEQSADVIYRLNIENEQFTYVNPSAERIFGYTSQEISSLKVRDVLTLESYARQREGLLKALASSRRSPEIMELEAVCKDGHTLPIEIHASFILNEQGNPVEILGVARDITERKRAEGQIKYALSLLNATLESTADGILVVDREGKIVSFNQKFVHMWHIPESIIASRDDNRALEFVLDQLKDPESFLVKVRKLYNQPTAESFDLLEFKDGRVFERYSQPQWVGEQSVGRVWSFRDVTERKRTEEALRESQQLLKKTFAGLRDAVFIIDAETVKIMDCNPAASEMFGYTREEMVGQTTSFLHIDSATLEEFRKHIYANVEEKGFLYLPEFRMKRKKGESFPTEHSVVPLEDDQGKRIGWVSVVRDLTEGKRAEKEMAALQEQLRQSQKMEAIGRLAGGIAHDFNNLLTIIKGYSQLSLLELKEGDVLKGNIEEIQRATERAANLTAQLLAFSRRQVMQMKVFDLNTLLRDLEEMLRRVIGEDVQLVTILTDDLGRTKIDPGQMEQVIMNLAINARDAMPSGGELIIETANVGFDETHAHGHIAATSGRYVMLSVSDTGMGMTPEVREQAFEPFFTTKEKGKGTGLGLSTVYGIVKQSGGYIWVYSAPGQGTAVKIYLPRVEEEADALLRRGSPDSIPRGSETVLVVEDEPSVRTLAAHILRDQGYRVLEAGEGEEALRVAQEHLAEIHLLLTDVVMPRMGGKELADRLKTLRPRVKVLFVSGFPDDAIAQHGILAPSIAFLQKPFSPATLAQKVREVLDR